MTLVAKWAEECRHAQEHGLTLSEYEQALIAAQDRIVELTEALKNLTEYITLHEGCDPGDLPHALAISTLASLRPGEGIKP